MDAPLRSAPSADVSLDPAGKRKVRPPDCSREVLGRRRSWWGCGRRTAAREAPGLYGVTSGRTRPVGPLACLAPIRRGAIGRSTGARGHLSRVGGERFEVCSLGAGHAEGPAGVGPAQDASAPRCGASGESTLLRRVPGPSLLAAVWRMSAACMPWGCWGRRWRHARCTGSWRVCRTGSMVSWLPLWTCSVLLK
jgi:hypothetical protein